MFGGGKGMGGGTGGGMLRTVGRVVARAGVATGNAAPFQESLSASSSAASSTNPASPTAASRATSQRLNNALSISSGASAFGSNSGVPLSANSGFPGGTWPAFSASSASSCCDESEWVSVEGCEDGKIHGLLDEYILGPVPSVDEVQNAVSALQQVFDASSYAQLIRDKYPYITDNNVVDQSPSGLMHQVPAAGLELDWKEPSLYLSNSRPLQPYGSNQVYETFRLLQTEPSVQKMVVSLSSDQAVWDAVLNNDVVRELRQAYHKAEDNSTQATDENSNGDSDSSSAAMEAVKWFFDNTKAKAMEIFEKITKLVNELFNPSFEDGMKTGPADPFEEKLRTSFLISVVVLLIVVVTRANRA